MDADLSHPPEAIPRMLQALQDGADFALGSRYVPGGSTDEGWGVFRWLNSRIATVLARPLTPLKDPMSGFFAIRRERFETAAPLSPVGYKIGLEMYVKGRCACPAEVPIHFANRRWGQSKLSFKEQLQYLRHLRRLFIFKYGNWAHFAQFAAVGFSGTIVNLAVLTVLLWMHTPIKAAVALAILVSILTNFLLNRRYSFSYARQGNFVVQLVGFTGASSIGAAVNYVTVLGALALWPSLLGIPQAASIPGHPRGPGVQLLREPLPGVPQVAGAVCSRRGIDNLSCRVYPSTWVTFGESCHARSCSLYHGVAHGVRPWRGVPSPNRRRTGSGCPRQRTISGPAVNRGTSR